MRVHTFWEGRLTIDGDLAKEINVNRIRNLQYLKELCSCPNGLAFAPTFRLLSDAWDACERADWMMCMLVQGKMLNKALALTLAIAFAKRAPTREGSYWVTRVANAGSDADAAHDAWATSDASAFSIAYCESIGFNHCLHATELRSQAETIRQIVGNPFKDVDSNKTE